jgi:phage portal protein BeeE
MELTEIRTAMADIVVSGTSLTYSNITDRREDFKQFTLLLPMYRLEEAMTELLPDRVDVKFNPAGLLRGSITERYATYKTAAEINNLTGETFMDVDEMRELEDREPIAKTTTPGGTNA